MVGTGVQIYLCQAIVDRAIPALGSLVSQYGTGVICGQWTLKSHEKNHRASLPPFVSTLACETSDGHCECGSSNGAGPLEAASYNIVPQPAMRSARSSAEYQTRRMNS